MKKEYHYVYRITNTKLHRHYYGTRSSIIEPHLDLGHEYFSTSSDVEFKEDQNVNPQNYKYVVVRVFETRTEALQLEIDLHSRFDVKNHPSFYNVANQTSTGFDRTGTETSKVVKAKISEALKGRIITQEHRNKISSALKDKPKTKEHCNNVSKSKKGSKHSKVTKMKMSKSSKGQVLSSETKAKISSALKDKPKTKEHCNNVSKALTGYKYKIRECPYCNLKGAGSGMTRFHFDNCKLRPLSL